MSKIEVGRFYDISALAQQTDPAGPADQKTATQAEKQEKGEYVELLLEKEQKERFGGRGKRAEVQVAGAEAGGAQGQRAEV